MATLGRIEIRTIDLDSVYGLSEKDVFSISLQADGFTKPGSGDDLNQITSILADVGTTGNVVLSGLQSIDGQGGAENLIVAVTENTDPIENGVYLMSSGAWVRSGHKITIQSWIRILFGITRAGEWTKILDSSEPEPDTDPQNYQPVGTITGSGTAGTVLKIESGTHRAGDTIISNLTDYVTIPVGSESAIGHLEVFDNPAYHNIYANRESDGKDAVHGISSGGGISRGGFFQHTNSGTALEVISTTGIAVKVSGRKAVEVITDATTSVGLTIDGNSISSANLFEIFTSSASPSGSVVKIEHKGATPTGIALDVVGKGTNKAISARHNGTATAATALFAKATGGTGVFMESVADKSGHAFRNSNTVVGVQPVFKVEQFHTLDTNHSLEVIQQGTGDIARFVDGGIVRAKFEDGGNFTLFGGFNIGGFVDVTTTGTTLSDIQMAARVDTSTIAIAITLPAVKDGRIVYIVDKEGNASNKNITINRAGTASIIGATSTIINTDFGYKLLYSNGTDWFFMSAG